MNARERYKGQVQKWLSSRPTVIVKTRSGAEFKLVKLDAIEVIKVFDILGIDMDKVRTTDAATMGNRMIDRRREILEKVVAPLSVSPRLMSEHEGQAEISAVGDDILFIGDLEPGDAADLIRDLLTNSQGQEGTALAEKFRPEQRGPDGNGNGGPVR
jgi:hypothetical protein